MSQTIPSLEHCDNFQRTCDLENAIFAGCSRRLNIFEKQASLPNQSRRHQICLGLITTLTTDRTFWTGVLIGYCVDVRIETLESRYSIFKIFRVSHTFNLCRCFEHSFAHNEGKFNVANARTAAISDSIFVIGCYLCIFMATSAV